MKPLISSMYTFLHHRNINYYDLDQKEMKNVLHNIVDKVK